MDSEDSVFLYFLQRRLWNTAEELLKSNRKYKRKNEIENYIWHIACSNDSARNSKSLSQSSWEQSWLALHLLLYLQDDGNLQSDFKNSIAVMQNEVDFNFLVHSLPYLNDDCVQELSHVQSRVLHASLVQKNLKRLRTGVEDVLEKSLLTQPGITHALINHLHCDKRFFENTNCQLSEIYVSAVKRCIESIRGATSVQEISAGHYEATMFSIMVLANIVECDQWKDVITLLCPLLTNDCKFFNYLLISTSCYSDLRIYNRLIELEDVCCMRHIKCKDIKKTDDFITLYKNITSEGRSVCLNEIFKRLIAGRTHWVEDIAILCSQLIINNNESKAEVCMKVDVFQEMWPVIAVCLWDHAHRQPDIIRYIEGIIDICQIQYPKVFTQLQKSLRRLKIMIDWLSSEGHNAFFDVNVMLSLINNNSVLYILKTTADITKVNSKSLHYLMNQFYSEGDHRSSTQQATFEAFNILLKTFSIILKATGIEQELRNCLVGLDAKRSYHDQKAKARKQYTEKVKYELQYIQEKIISLEPLSFRLEILEDVFSLLFLRTEDMQEEGVSDSGPEDEDCTSHTNLCLVRSLTEPLPLSAHLYRPHVTSQSFPPTHSFPLPKPQNASKPVSAFEKNFFTSSKISEIRRDERKQGFICSPWLLKDVLSLVKVCLTEVKAEDELNTDHSRITRLRSAVEDAKWKLDMLSGLYTKEFTITERHDETWVYLGSESSDSDDGEIPVSSFKTATKRTKRIDSTDKSSESSSNVTGKTSGHGMRTRRLKSVECYFGSMSIPSELINLMLASPSNLVMYFVANDDINKAKYIIKKYGMEDCDLAMEINFLKSYNTLRENIMQVKLKPTHVGLQKESALKVINEAASAGAFAASITSLVKTFFAVTSVPSGSIVNEGLTLLDLAITVPSSSQHSTCLLDLASEYFTLSSSLLSGIHDFCKRLCKIHQYSVSLLDIFCNPSLPFVSSQKIKDIDDFWKSLDDIVGMFKESQEIKDSQQSDLHFLHLTSYTKSIRGILSDQYRVERQGDQVDLMHQVFVYLSMLSQLISPYIPMVFGDAVAADLSWPARQSRGVEYLSDSTVLGSRERSPVLSFRCGHSHRTKDTCFDLLQWNLEDLIGRLIFKFSVDPMDIEVVTQHIGLDLVYYIIKNCTPAIPVTQLCHQPDIIILNITKDGDNRKLNPVNDTIGEIHPGTIVSEFLTELIDVIETEQRINGTLHYQFLRSNERINQILKKTSQLTSINLNLLSPGDETLAFLINVTNLMWVHALIDLETSDTKYGLVTKSQILRQLSCASVGYEIGKLGFVSLLQLHNTLCMPLLPSSDIVSSEVLDFRFSSDPRVVFVLGNAYMLSPKIQVMDSETLDVKLEQCMVVYVQENVKFTDTAVILPRLLHCYLDYVTQTQGPESEDGSDNISNCSRERSHILAEFLKENTVSPDISKKDIKVVQEIGFTIRLNYKCSITKHTNVGEEPTVVKWKEQGIQESILKFLAKRSSLLGLLVEKLHSIEEAEETGLVEMPLSILECYLNSEYVAKFSRLYNDNIVLAILQPDANYDQLWPWFDTVFEENNLILGLEMICLLSETFIKSEPRLSRLKDGILMQLSSSPDGWQYCQNISDGMKMVQSILSNVRQWPGNGCVEALETLLSTHGDCLPGDVHHNATNTLCIISTCQKVVEVCGHLSWKAVFEAEPFIVLKDLLDKAKPQLALEWTNQNSLLLSEIIESYTELLGQLVSGLLESGSEAAAIETLSSIPEIQAIQVCDYVVNTDASIKSLQSVIIFLKGLKSLNTDQSLKYSLLNAGIQMYLQLPLQDKEWYRELVAEPELIVEQLIMCTRLSTLESLLSSLKDCLAELPPGSSLSSPCLDALLRRYASKALDIHVRTKSLPIKKHQIAVCQVMSREKFSPPEIPPTKEEWVPNDEVTECMCCQTTVFSMFNRRHHCRRCGRVVCASCSPHRIRVTGYGNVVVRVCNDCLDYVSPKATQLGVSGNACQTCSVCRQRLPSVGSDSTQPEWQLTRDPAHSSTVRDEFSYTHAPSVSLCISILKLHSEHAALLRFLLSTIEGMLQLIRPVIPGTINSEVDHLLLMSMIRSLLDFARLRCTQQNITSDWEHIDRLFAEVDLLTLLVSTHQTYKFIPTEPLRGPVTLRMLRENLLEHELWSLALEVSTKAGLEYSSVWSAWGKACLKAGAWTEAREKFSHCNMHKRETQHAALLSDILQILQNTSWSSDLKSRLSRLQILASGAPDSLKVTNKLDQRVYDECLYYLRLYGSHTQLLQFFLKNNEIKSAVELLIDASVESTVFIESLVLPSLRSGQFTSVCTEMANIDKSLLIWKDCLRSLCAFCERKKMFNVLYQIQVWMNDNIRAAMTCIHFYKNKASSYSDLICNISHLETALVHLQTALKQPAGNRLVMQLRKEDIIQHLDTVKLQIEITSYLSKSVIEKTWPLSPPTVFGSSSDKSSLIVKLLVKGENFDRSFHLATRIIDTWQLDKSTVFCEASASLVREGKVTEICKLGAFLEQDSDLCNKILLSAIRQKPLQPDTLINLITDTSVKITALIECGQLKSAYLLAVKWERLDDVVRIMQEAEKLNQPLIYKICLKRLGKSENE